MFEQKVESEKFTHRHMAPRDGAIWRHKISPFGADGAIFRKNGATWRHMAIFKSDRKIVVYFRGN